MAIKDDIASEVDGILSQLWTIRGGTVAPETEDVVLAGGAVKLEATMLYADLVDSTSLAIYDRRVAARVFKSFLAACSKIIRDCGGYIRSFDGDRVMGVFIGSWKNTSAVTAALKINYAFLKIIEPKLQSKYAVFRDGTYKLGHCVGVDTSEVLVVRAGIRNNNDLVWVGSAPNVAAKLSGIRAAPYNSWITGGVYDSMNDSAKKHNGTEMWEQRVTVPAIPGGVGYRSSWTWEP
ncbi:MAG TPA: adenylate/guanylate cyclase domain-containing protein [Candidatus Dormibacteraeota bacterium]|nr:adenylate/guanylate cyclase domain-containing protein [Candidatus Dormibacteraeota bacterium]